MKGEDPAVMKPFLETMKKVWGNGVDFSSKMAFSEIFCKFFGDSVSYFFIRGRAIQLATALNGI